MAENHMHHFENLLRQIRSSHPQTAANLERLDDQFGPKVADYAASFIAHIEVRVKFFGPQSAGALLEDDIDNFNSLQVLNDQPLALEFLADVLESHYIECQTAAPVFSN